MGFGGLEVRILIHLAVGRPHGTRGRDTTLGSAWRCAAVGEQQRRCGGKRLRAGRASSGQAGGWLMEEDADGAGHGHGGQGSLLVHGMDAPAP
jgi:hypothetical protein